MVGANDLSLELGDVGNFEAPKFLDGLGKVARACRNYGKIFGIGGIYTRLDLMDKIVNELGARWILGGNDQPLLLDALKANNAGYKSIEIEPRKVPT